MSIIETVRREREDLARVMKKHTGIRKIVEDLYPDNAHFIYELLQNAEDTQARNAHFVLTENCLAFEHDGRPFEPGDIEAITDIGEGTKAGSDDKIGRFGVGFKAVFAYSETPHIWSPTFSFKISELVLPERLDPRPDLGKNTRFEFPFDNPKKNPATAFAEIEAGLSELAETTLLFVTHLESIGWRIGDDISGEVLCIKHSDYHFEVLKQAGGTTTTSSHFLKFARPVQGLEKQRVAVAFALDLLVNHEDFDPNRPLAKQLKIVPATPGRVAVFFPAEKETSGLRFHLHAPFVPELSRASIKETPANRPLFQQLASLCAASLHQIRDMGLLSADFLGVLPNPLDNLPDRYRCIRESVVGAMNTEPLTPTQGRGYAPARQLLQAKASLKDLLALEDLEFLVEYEDEPYQWAVGVPQKNSEADRFLAGLAITDWDIEDFVKLLEENTSAKLRHSSRSSLWVRDPDEEFMAWLYDKSLEWHQKLYALLYSELSPEGDCARLESLKIVRLSNGDYGVGNACFFPDDDADADDLLPRVDVAVYTSKKSKSQQENARKLLEELGVREVGEAEQIESILLQRYQESGFSPRKKDLKRFVAFFEKEPQNADLFDDYFIFQCDDAEGNWCRPEELYLDLPFTKSGLATYYNALGEQAGRHALADWYQRAEVRVERIARFAEAVGVQTRLIPTEANCGDNPDWPDVLAADVNPFRGGRGFKDFTIDGIETLLCNPSITISRLFWTTMQNVEPDCLELRYPKHHKGGPSAASQLVHHLRESAWIPQGDKVFSCPAQADRELLPEGFPFDAGWPWLKAIHFGRDRAERVEARQQKLAIAKSLELDCQDEESFERLQLFNKLPTDEQIRILARTEDSRNFVLPAHVPSNPERRAERVGRQAADAPARESEKRSRSIAIGTGEVKEEAAQYLRQQYTNVDGVMICQICKSSLPFKLDDGKHYFEKIEFLPGLVRRYYQNHLALCPNHAAMFQHVNSSSEELTGSFLAIEDNAMEIILAQEGKSIYFTGTHIHDLQALIKADADDQVKSGS